LGARPGREAWRGINEHDVAKKRAKAQGEKKKFLSSEQRPGRAGDCPREGGATRILRQSNGH